MIAQIGEVLATYWRKAISNRLAMLATIVPVLGIAYSVFLEKKSIRMATWLGIFGPAPIALHFKEQIIQIHQRRIPNAAAVNVIVVVGLLVLCGLALPATHMAIGTWSWGALGFIFALTAVTFALFTIQSGRLFLLVTPLIFMVSFDSVQKWLAELCEQRHEALGLALLAAGACGISATLARLLQTSEEDASYFGWLDLRSYPRTEPSADDPSARSESWKSLGWRLITPSERRVPLWQHWGTGSQWQRIRLRRSGYQDELLLRLFPEALYYALDFALLLNCDRIFGVGIMTPASLRSILVKGSAFLIILLPALKAAVTAWQLRKTAAIEFLRPAGRSQFLIDTGLTYAYQMAVGWGVNSMAWCGLAYVFGSMDWREMLSVVVLTAVIQALLFGLGAWLMRYMEFATSVWLFPIVIAWIFLTGFLPYVLGIPGLYGTGIASFAALLWVTPGIVIVSALITWDAYRRWMRTEIG